MEKNEHANKKINRKVFGKSILVGLIAGIIFSLFFLVLHYFTLIEIDILTSIKKGFFKDGATFNWYGKIMLVIIVGMISIIVSVVLSLVYFAIFKKINIWYIGALYGVCIWSILYIGIPLLVYGNVIVAHYSVHTHINTLCLFVLYGTFIGYTISFEYENEMHHAMQK